MKHTCRILATVLAAALSATAKTFDWPIEAPTAGARLFTAYHGETVSFNLKFGGAMTNLSPVCIYYQTNGMDKAEWFGPIPGTVFHPTNDCGAATYRFFIRSTDPDGVDYTANGTLRLLDSPGFVPNEVPFPVKALDFAKIEVLNPPWGEGPGNYAAVSNAAMNAAQNATNLVADATNGIPRITESESIPGAAANAARAVYANEAILAERASVAGAAGYAYALGDRSAPAIIEQLDAATETNEQQSAEIANRTELGDDRVYEAAGLGDFAWSSDRADIVAALGSQQPDVGYESDGWVEWYLDFYVGPTNYYGYAYVEESAKTVSFDVYGWYWDEDTYDEYYDEATVVGTRASQGAVPTGDRYARQADVTSMQSEMSSLRTLYNGETKVMRDGGAGQYGTGWGYLQHPLSGESRYWRIRVPKWTAFPGAQTNNLAATNVYGTLVVGPNRWPSSTVGVGWPVPLNPASWCPTWGVRRSLVATRGVNGSDAVSMADWDVGLSLLSTNGTDLCAVNFRVTQTSASPVSFSVSPDVSFMTPVWFPTGDIVNPSAVSNLWYIRYVDLAPQTRQWTVGGMVNEATVTVKGFIADPGQVETSSNGTVPMTFWTVVDMAFRTKGTSSYAQWGAWTVVTNALTRFTATATCASLSSLENVRVPYYRLVTTRDCNLYYDAALGETYRIVSSNGVFFSEWHCEGDWRKGDGL